MISMDSLLLDLRMICWSYDTGDGQIDGIGYGWLRERLCGHLDGLKIVKHGGRDQNTGVHNRDSSFSTSTKFPLLLRHSLSFWSVLCVKRGVCNLGSSSWFVLDEPPRIVINTIKTPISLPSNATSTGSIYPTIVPTNPPAKPQKKAEITQPVIL